MDIIVWIRLQYPDSINPNLEYDQSISITEIAVKKYLTHHRGDRLESSTSIISTGTAIISTGKDMEKFYKFRIISRNMLSDMDIIGPLGNQRDPGFLRCIV